MKIKYIISSIQMYIITYTSAQQVLGAEDSETGTVIDKRTTVVEKSGTRGSLRIRLLY